MIKRKLKVFHGLVNYGTQAGLFAAELRNQGVDAISVSYPDRFKRQIDIELLHGGNIFQKILRHSWNWIRRFYWFFRYNTFHFYYGTSLSQRQWDLPLYRLFGKKVVMHYLGGDIMNYRTVVDRYKLEKEHRFTVSTKKHDFNVAKRVEREVKYSDFQLVCAPVYSEYLQNSYVLPLAIDLDQFEFSEKTPGEKLIIMHAPTDRVFKGTDYIEKAVKKLIDEKYPIEFDLVEGVTHQELLRRYKNCDIFIDQISVGWYGTASIEAMATGRPTICFIDPLYNQYIDFGHKIPIINATKESIYDVIKETIINWDRLKEISINSRKFVEEVHDSKILTKKLLSLYQENL